MDSLWRLGMSPSTKPMKIYTYEDLISSYKRFRFKTPNLYVPEIDTTFTSNENLLNAYVSVSGSIFLSWSVVMITLGTRFIQERAFTTPNLIATFVPTVCAILLYGFAEWTFRKYKNILHTILLRRLSVE